MRDGEDANMVNEKGRPIKKRNADWNMTSFYLPDCFKPAWIKLNVLSASDRNEEFRRYCMEIEEEDLNVKKQGLRGLYIRWILSKHVIKNLNKLQDNERKNNNND